MKRWIRFSLLNYFVVSSLSPVLAQEKKPITFQINSDLRARLGSTGGSSAAAYQNSVGLGFRLAPGWRFHYEGGQNNAPLLTSYGARFNQFITQEASLEKLWESGERLQMGLVRLPFGLYDNRETYASGIIDYPLLRGDFALQSVNWGVPGLKLAGGSPSVQFEGSVFGGQSSGMWNNLNNTRGVSGRVQLYRGNLILGLSHWTGSQSSSLAAAGERTTSVTGIDFRYTRPHLLLRGEVMTGRLAGERVNGWYLDLYYHMPKYQKITWVARLEEFRPQSASPLSKQLTLGMRYTVDANWVLAVNWRKNNGNNYSPNWTPPTARGGDVFFQAYRKINW